MNNQRRFHQNQNGKAVEICPGDDEISQKMQEEELGKRPRSALTLRQTKS
jgi:hypothetical protein